MQSRFHKPDYILFGITVFLFLFGILILASASTVIAYERFNDSFYYLKHQLFFGVLPGIAFFFFLYALDYHVLKRWIHILFPCSLVLLFLVFIPGFGVSYGRAQSWLSLGGVSFQPTEIVKLTFVLYFSLWLSERQILLKHFLLLLGGVGLLFILQPDLGGFLILAMIAFTMYFISGVSWAHIGILASSGMALLTAMIVVAPYRMSRILTFLNPDFDRLGVGYHVQQALLAVGSGGIFGLGLGQSRQKFLYLPEVIGDSIFAIMAEELGFLITAAFLVLWVIFLLRGFRIARSSPDAYGWYVAIGMTVWLVLQAFVNIGAMVRVFPLTGLTLPLMSYGGTSLVVTLGAIGILLNISRQTIIQKK